MRVLAREGDQILPHAQIGKDLPSFRNQRHTQAGDLIRTQALDALSAKRNRTGSCRRQSQHRANRRALAHPVAAEQSRDFASIESQVDAEQNLTRIVGRLQTLHVEQREIAQTVTSSPRYARFTSALARIAVGAPVAIMRPDTSTEMRSARRNTASISCSTSRTPTCPRSCAMSSTM